MRLRLVLTPALVAALALGGCGPDETARPQVRETASVPAPAPSVQEASPEGSELLQSLRAGGFVIYFRHAATVPGGDADLQNLANCVRTLDTANLAFGRAEQSVDLTSLPQAGGEAEEERRVMALRGLLATEPPSGLNTVLVGHLFNIQRAADISIAEGEAAVFEPRGEGGYALVATVSPEEWLTLEKPPRLGPAAVISAIRKVDRARTPACDGKAPRSLQ